MSSSSDRRWANANAYIWGVIAVGVGVIGHSMWRLWTEPPGLQLLVLAALTLLTGSFTVKIPSLSARLSVSETFVFASALLFGPPAGTATVVLDTLVICFWLTRTARTLPRVLFNATAPATAIWLSSHAFYLFSNATPGTLHTRQIGTLIVPLFAFALLYFLINTFLVSGALATQQNANPFSIWRSNFPPVSITYFVGASIAMLIVAYTPQIDFTVLGMVVPFLLISYLTFRSSMGRLEDAHRHVSQVNVLYLSTIETLAMAVDAKDQITHGHIRRVQTYATELARRLGVTDEHQLKAIEAAALLHDMGKLAIPEHILNKPGKLTSGEFETMKRHSDIGADLLSSIPFPYPVVPIVRHHHENWDGTGYPNRIAGTDIPLGARILSVVDCFDALTSDRPYRPRLSTEAAFAIIHERRGTMYDPLIVDTFISAYPIIAPSAIRAGEDAKTLVPPTSLLDLDKANALDKIHAGSTEGAALLEVRRLLSTAQTPSEAVAAISATIRQITPATVVALYYLDTERDVLRCAHAVGNNAALLTGFEIPNGERTTGWAAAHQCSIMNSAASLDLGSVAEASALRATLCVPVKDGATVIAALTLYSTLEAPFADRHQYLTEQIASFLVGVVRNALRQKSIVSFREQPRLHIRS